METSGESNWRFEIFLIAAWLNALIFRHRNDRGDLRDLPAISVNQGDAARRFNRPRDLRFGREHRHT